MRVLRISLSNSPYWGNPKKAAKEWVFNILILFLIAGIIAFLVPGTNFISTFAVMLGGFMSALALTFYLKQRRIKAENTPDQ